MERYIVGLLGSMTIEDVSKNLGMSWDTVKNIEKEYLKKHYSKPDLKNLKFIAIDEFAVKKGHNYMTVVMDLEQGNVVYIESKREKESLSRFWKQVKKINAQIQAVAIDMWPAYISSVLDNCPDAKIVFDRFHITKKMNEAIDTARRELARDEENYNQKKLVKGTKWLLLKNPENLTENSKKQLEDALKMNKGLSEAYYLREELKQFWFQKDKNAAIQYIKQWIKKVENATVFSLRKLAGTISAHLFGIINWYDFPISTGALEGFNNKIKVLKRKAYGYRDEDFFKLKILALHIHRYALLR